MQPNQYQQRRSTGQMPVRQRHLGLTAVDRRDEESQWKSLNAFLGQLAGLMENAIDMPLLLAGLAQATAMLARATAMRTIVWDNHPVIDKVFLILFFKTFYFS